MKGKNNKHLFERNPERKSHDEQIGRWANFVKNNKNSIICKIKFIDNAKAQKISKLIKFIKAKIKFSTKLYVNMEIVDELIQKKGKFKFLVREI